MGIERMRSRITFWIITSAPPTISCCRVGEKVELFNSDIQDWRITFADTGTNSNIGQRLKAVERYLEGEEEFLANYSDGLSDLPLPQQLAHFQPAREDRQLSVRATESELPHGFAAGGEMEPGLGHPRHQQRAVRINGGFFVFKKKIFDYIREKEELVNEPFHRLIEEKQLIGYRYDGFWAGMDTFKDKQELESLWRRAGRRGKCGRPTATARRCRRHGQERQ